MRTSLARTVFGTWLVGGLLGCSEAELVEAGPFGEVAGTAPVVSVRDPEALVAWHRVTPNEIRVSSYVTGSGWSAPAVLASGGFPEVALSRSGRAFVVYTAGASVRATVRTAGIWGPEKTLDTVSGNVSVAADAAGNAVAAWANASSGVKARTYLDGSGWQPAVSIGAAGAYVEVAMNDAGVGVAAWCDAAVIRTSRYVPGTGWEAPTASSANCCSNPWDLVGRGFRVAIAETGAIFTIGNGSSPGRICARRYVPGSGWTGTVVLANGSVGQPALAANMGGSAFAAWVDAGSNTVKTRSFIAGSGWQPTLTADDVAPSGVIGAGMNPSGYGAVVYRKGGLLKDVHSVASDGTTVLAPVSMESLPGTAYYLNVGYDPNVDTRGMTVWQHVGGGSTGEEVRASHIGL
jgi:hypothetical protein